MSYYYNLNSVETLVQGTRKTLSYPEVKSNTDYSLKVKTCADKEGKNCGEYSPVVTFKTEQIKSISSISTEKLMGFFIQKIGKFLLMLLRERIIISMRLSI